MGDREYSVGECSSGNAAGEPPPPPSSSGLSSSEDVELVAIAAESLRAAEEATREVLSLVRPTVVSNERRETVIGLVQRLIASRLNIELFPFGSVPLKTYLPDGDIDLTAICHIDKQDALSWDVFKVLQAEESNQFAEVKIKDVQYIHAEVKVVKCLIHSIVVDISFNQLGGLGTLFFLEQVDRLVGRDNLFKRSIILIKAWCYYESRVLGAHYGLISTYALETLILYIFHFFHSSLDGPFSVLYKFLDYFSQFDWDTYCLSLHGPVAISSLPDGPVAVSSLSDVAENLPENDGDLLLTKDFLENCKGMTALPRAPLEERPRPFPWKHLNIIDPMKENNNLGRSINQSNLYRIRNAFTYGARKLREILSLPPDIIKDEVRIFFQNSLTRHGHGNRPDVDGSIHLSCIVNPASPYSYNAPRCEEYKENNCHNAHWQPSFPRSLGSSTSGDVMAGSEPVSVDKTRSIIVSGSGSKDVVLGSGSKDVYDRSSDCHISDEASSGSECVDSDNKTIVDVEGSANDAVVSAGRAFLKGFNEDFNNEIGPMKPVSSANPLSQYEGGVLKPYAFTEEFLASRPYITFFRESTTSQSSSGSNSSTNAFHRDDQGFSEGFSCLAELSGDQDSQLAILAYSQRCHDLWGAGVSYIPIPFDLVRLFPIKSSLDTQYPQSNISPFSQVPGVMPLGRFPPGPGYLSGPPPGPYCVEEMPMQRGTGTYIPNTVLLSYKERNPLGRGRNGTPGHSPARNNYSKQRSDLRWGFSPDPIVGNHETHPPSSPTVPSPSHSPSPVSSPSRQLGSGYGRRSGPIDFFAAHRSVANSTYQSDCFSKQSEATVSHDQPRNADSSTSTAQRPGSSSAASSSTSTAQRPGSSSAASSSASNAQRPGSSSAQGSASKTYELINDEDFPPLS